MSTYLLPTRSDGVKHYSFSVRLDTINYRFQFDFNDRDGTWYFLLSDNQGTPLVSRRVIIGCRLLSATRFMDLRLPPGEIIAIDTSGTGVEAGLTDLGARVQLTYTDLADLLAL